MTKHVLGLLALVAVAPSFGQSVQDNPAGDGPILFGPNFGVELRDWRAAHGSSWDVRVDPTTGYLEMLYGGSAAPPFTPDPSSNADWVELTRHFASLARDMHGLALGELGQPRVTYLPLGLGNGSDKVAVRLLQEHGGLRVENGVLNALFDTSGRLLSLHSTGAPGVSGTSAPAVSAASATQTALEEFASTTGLQPTRVGEPELLFAQVELDRARRARLAWQLEVASLRQDEEPVGWLYTIDALSGQVLRRDTTIHYFDVTGQVLTHASPGTLPDMAANPPQQLSAGHIRITSSAGTVFADRDGNFTYPGVNAPLNLTVTYWGTYNRVNTQAGSNHSVTFNNVQPNQANTLLLNPTPSQFITAEANSYRHVGIVGDFLRDTNPNDTTANFLALSNANLNQTCNAHFDGGSINLYRAGGGCNNTGYSSVVAHEFGHWLNVRYGTGNGSDGMGEGNADVFSMYVYDNPIVGEFFTTGGGFVRTGNNTRQFCGDSNPGCYGGVHANGEVWMGAAWKVRRNLNTSLGNALGDATANALFSGWLNTYNQSQIRSIIEIQWLTLDDDDGDINNGTPNFLAIDAAFREQGFPGFDLVFVGFDNVTQLQNTTNEAGPYVVNADVVAELNPPLTAAEVLYSVDGGPFLSVPMGNIGGDTFQGQIPGTPSPAEVRYYVSGTDSSSMTQTFPAGGASEALVFYVGDVTSFLTTEFEGPGNDGWTVGDPLDTATTGIWVRGNPIGTAAQPEDDHTPAPGVNCFFTGQGPAGGSVGQNDVDNGRTTLKTPVFSLVGLDDPTISYWRWYSNNQGATPNTDIFRIDISNDGGSSWTSVETVGPGGTQSNGGWFQHSFHVNQIIALTASMQMRFVAADEGAGSIVEAAVDDVIGIDVSSSCPAPVSYCPGVPNSTGNGAILLVLGSQSVAANDFTLFSGGAPPFEFGIFLYGAGQTSLPVGNGTLCIANPFYRLHPTVQTDLLGQAMRQVDLTAPPVPAAQISAGSTWNFQFWFRDANGGGAQNNLSEAIAVPFCD